MARTLVEELEILIKDISNNNPAPKTCTIKDIYPEGYVDVSVVIGGDESIIPYRPSIGSPIIGEEALLVFIDGNINGGYVICDNGGEISSSFTYTVEEGVLYLDNVSATPIISFTGMTSDGLIMDTVTLNDYNYNFGVVGTFKVNIIVGEQQKHIIIKDGELVKDSDEFEYSYVDGVLKIEQYKQPVTVGFHGMDHEEVFIEEYELLVGSWLDIGVTGSYDIVFELDGKHLHVQIEDGVVVNEELSDSALTVTRERKSVMVDSSKQTSFTVFGFNIFGEFVLGETTVNPVDGVCSLRLDCIDEGAFVVTAQNSDGHGHKVML